jgi:GNAT superfamily N-acetyltransferase
MNDKPTVKLPTGSSIGRQSTGDRRRASALTQGRPADRGTTIVTPRGTFDVRPATLADLDQVYALLEQCERHVRGRVEMTRHRLLLEWQEPGFELERSSRVVTDAAGEVVAYADVWDTDPMPVRTFAWAQVRPDHEGLGIGTHLMDWAEMRLREAVDRVPAEARVVMQGVIGRGYEPARRLLARRGMDLVRQFQTRAVRFDSPPAEPAWPSGIQIATMRDVSQLADIVRATRDAFADHWGHVEQPFEIEYALRLHYVSNTPDFDPTLWFLAMDGEEIAAVSLCREKSDFDSELGWVGTLGVRRPWRRQGLGLAMLLHSFGAFKRRGRAGAALRVDGANLTGATRLYERAGMEVVEQMDVYEKELRPGIELRKT